MQPKLSELFEKYLDECRFAKRLRPETVRGYAEVFGTFSVIMPEVVHMEDVSTEMLTVFFKRLETRQRRVGRSGVRTGIKLSTVKTYGSKLKSFFDWLVRNAYAGINPMSGLRLPVPLYEDHRALKKDEVQRILASITTHASTPFVMRRDLAMVYCFLFCGLRKNELLSLKVSDVDPVDRLLTVRAETSKSKRTRRLHIHPTLWLHLGQYLKERKEQKKGCAYLWVAQGKDHRLTAHGLKHWVKRLENYSGVKFHVHRFRHTFATNLGHSGASVIKIQRLMGHSQITMTMAYMRSIKAEDMSEEIDKLSIENLA